MENENLVTVGGLWFNKKTPERVMTIIAHAYHSGKRIRVFYGDTETGRDWMEEYDVMGTVGRSTGKHKVPLLINNSRSHGGTAIMCSHIVKITIDKTVVYKHPDYYIHDMKIGDGNPDVGLDYSVLYKDTRNNGEWVPQANFKTKKQAEKYIAFMKGELNGK